MLICSSLSPSWTCCMRTAFCAPAPSEQLLVPLPPRRFAPSVAHKTRGTWGILQLVNVEDDKRKVAPRLANESSHNCENPEDSALQHQRKTKTSTTVARGAAGSSAVATQLHTCKCSHATAAPECTTVGCVSHVSPGRQLGGKRKRVSEGSNQSEILGKLQHQTHFFFFVVCNLMATFKSIPPVGLS